MVALPFLAACRGAGSGNDNLLGPSDPLPAGAMVVYAAVGASDVTGIGSTSPCLALFADCPDSRGYVFVAARDLRSRGHLVTVRNLSIPTAVISTRVRTLGLDYGYQALGSIIDQLMPFVPENATMVTVFAGANDVRAVLAALAGGAGGSNPAGFVDDQIRAFADDYAALVAGIRNRAPGARIVVLNLPNMGTLPFLASAGSPARQAAQRASVGFTRTAINVMAAQGARVVDLMCDARFYQQSIYSDDGFHPNDQGHRVLADHVVGAATSASYPAPQSSCPPMTLVP